MPEKQTQLRKESDIARMPGRPQFNEQVTIIGGGLMGMTAAWMLSEAGYPVMLIEQMAEPMSGTSKDALGIHLGGRYPHSPQTAAQCLESGIRFKQLMPFAVSKKRGPLNFLIAENSQVSYPKYIDFYKNHRNINYANRPQEEQVFGEPETFFRELEQNELQNFNNIAGGITTQEACYHMPQAKKILINTLRARGVDIRTATEVVGIDKPNTRYEVTWTNEDGNTGVIESDYVVNTAGYNARVLSQELGIKPSVNLQLRFFSDVKIGRQTERAYPNAFVLVPGGPGRDAMHYVPLRRRVASLVGCSETIERTFVEQEMDLTIPQEWKEILRRDKVTQETLSQQIIDTARSLYMPKLGQNTQTIEMRPGVAVSFSQSQFDKTQEGLIISDELPDFVTAVPTKASHAVTLGLELVKNLIDQSTQKGIFSELTDYAEQVSSGKNIWYL